MSTVDMPPSSSSWKHLSSASSKFSSLKGFMNHSVSSKNVAGSISRVASAVGATDERRQSWRTWAAQKLRGRNAQGDSTNEVLTLFPGWAARRYAVSQGSATAYSGDSSVPFEIDIFVSGYAVSRRSKEQATRSQRAFLRLAKGFAALPKIIDQHSQADIVSTEGTLHGFDIPKVSEEFRVLDQQFQSLGFDESESEDETESDSSLTTSDSSPSPSTPLPKQIDTPADVLQKLHYNLESRLRLFWSSILPSRTVRLHLFASPRPSSGNHNINVFEHAPLASQDVETSVDGSFGARFHVSWRDLCQHPSGVHIAYCDPLEEHDLTIVAELLPPPLNSSASTSNPSHNPSPASRSQSQNRSPHHSHSHSHSHSHHHPHLHNILTALPNLPTLPSLHLSLSHSTLSHFLTPTRTTYTRITTPITHTPIRVISDIDDTVKHSGVTEGARIAFHNVFVKELKDGVIPGMGEWYMNMWDKGVRFHYVSNGPFEYLSLLHEFFGISKLPPGSIKLKSYAGRSLFSGLLSNPAARKRAGVADILDSLSCSKFILIGDSGEQDLELYAELAKERPDQVIAVFIRDVEETLYDPIDDPTGWSAVGANTRPSGGSTGILSTSSGRILAAGSRDERTTPRFIKAKRAFSDTFASMRASASGRSPDRLLQEEPLEDELTDTPRPQSLPTFTFSPPAPDPTIPSSPSSISSLSSPASSTSLTSSPVISKPPFTYITKPPAPVPPLSVPTSGSTLHSDALACPKSSVTIPCSPSGSQRLRPHQYGPPTSTSKLPPSPHDTLPSASSTYYKPESNSRYASPSGNRRGRYGSLGFGSNGGYGGYEDGSTWSSSASSVGSSGGGGGGGSTGRILEGEKKRQDLQMRVYRARTQMPGGVKLRVFRNPSECTEDVDLLLPVQAGPGVRHQVLLDSP